MFRTNLAYKTLARKRTFTSRLNQYKQKHGLVYKAKIFELCFLLMIL